MSTKSKSYEKSAPRVYIRTFGCQMNDRDSEFIRGIFLERGYGLAESPDAADIVLFNTCSVREHAEERAINNMVTLLRTKLERQDGRVFGIVGCMAQAMKEELFTKLPQLDIICGTGNIVRLPELVEEAANGKRCIAVENVDNDIPEMATQYRESKSHAYVSIMRGCNNFCSYCIVPYVRGIERSRSVKDIVEEIRDLVRKGIREITLLGQNVNSYKGVIESSYKHSSVKTCNFVQLLRRINEIEGIEKIAFLTSHPKDATIELFRTIRDCKKLVRHLHLPLQSGSDRILALMNRGYTRLHYLELVRCAREIITDLRLTTDIIVGFPTETDTDFKDTLDLLKRIEFDLAYIFRYSPRPGTEAARMRDDVPFDVKKARHRCLLNTQIEISRRKKNEKKNPISSN